VEFIFVFTVILIEMLFVNLPEIIKIIRALRIYTFMYDEVLTILLMNEVVIAMRALQNGSF
jgi:hypothetical protein